MRNISICLALVLSCGMGGVSAASKIITLPAPKGSNPPGAYARVFKGGYNKDLAAVGARNLLGTALNLQLVREKASTGGALNSPNFKNGTADTVPYFNSWFVTGSRNSLYTYSMMGHSPKAGGTTGIDNRLLPLIISLDDGRGNVLFTFDPTGGGTCSAGSDVNVTVESPIYDASSTYPGGKGLPADTGQFADTVQRAEFNSVRTADWHTPLNAPQNADCSLSIYRVTLDPTAWAFLVDQNNNVVGEAVDITVMTTVFHDLLAIENAVNGLPNSVFAIIVTDTVAAYIPRGPCCALGFHNAQSGLANPAGILVWAWAVFLPNNNIFLPSANVLNLSHEISEAYNDPFVNTSVAPWVDGAVIFAQGNLECGDVTEAMNGPDAVFPVPLNTPDNGLYPYRVQNVALLQWFTRNPLNGGAYSWPNTHTLGQCPHNLSSTPNFCYGEGSAGFFFGPPF